MDEANLLMDKWRPSDVQILMRKFRQYASKRGDEDRETRTSSVATGTEKPEANAQSKDGGSRGTRTHPSPSQTIVPAASEADGPLQLDLEGFCSIFSELEGHIPQSVAEAAFSTFCAEGSKTLDFREFCTAVTICCYGSPEKKAGIIFNLFDSDHDGFLSPGEVEGLVHTALASMERVESDDRASHKSTWMRQAGNDLISDLSKTEKMSRDEFLDWADKHMVITYMLELFRVIPTSEIEKRTAMTILKQCREMKEGETWHVLSCKWWEEWCLYTQYRAFDKDVLVRKQNSQGSELQVVNESDSVSSDEESAEREETGSTANIVDVLVVSVSENNPTPRDPAEAGKADADEGGGTDASVGVAPGAIESIDDSPARASEVSKSTVVPASPSNRSLKARSNGPGGLIRSRSLSHTSGDRPGPIKNGDLEGQVANSVKVNLLEGHDYVLIPPALWIQLSNWYGGGPKIPRTVIAHAGAYTPARAETPYYDPPVRDGVRLEIHPLVLTFTTMDQLTGKPKKGGDEWKPSLSAAVTVEEMTMLACTELGAVTDLARLWIKPAGGEWTILEEKQLSLGDADVESGDVIMIEAKEDSDSKWPRDKIQTYLENFRDFEINTRVDALDNQGRWYPGTIVDFRQRRANKYPYESDDEDDDDENDEAVEEVRVHFDRFKSRWDEWYPTHSEKLQPVFTKSEPRRQNQSSRASRTSRFESICKAPRDGAVGLENLGNTCYMNSVLQCVSNTPILRNYFRSGMFEEELNISNANGTAGMITQEMAELIGNLWIDQSEHPVSSVQPKHFKKALATAKTQFAGYDQQDAHEFLSVLLDAMHEDLNRVVPESKKPGKKKKKLTSFGAAATPSKSDSEDSGKDKGTADVAAGPGAVEEEGRGGGGDGNGASGGAEQNDTREAADGAEKHSVDNSEGQSTVRDEDDSPVVGKGAAPVSSEEDCSKLADEKWKEHLEKNRSTIVDLFHGQLRRKLECSMCGHKHYQFEPFQCLSVALQVQFAYTVIFVPLLGPGKAATSKTAYGVFTPQVGLVGDLKLELASVCGISSNRLTIATVENNRIGSIRPDRQQLHTIREDDVLYAFERPQSYDDISGHPKVIVSATNSASNAGFSDTGGGHYNDRNGMAHGYNEVDPIDCLPGGAGRSIFSCCLNSATVADEVDDEVDDDEATDDIEMTNSTRKPSNGDHAGGGRSDSESGEEEKNTEIRRKDTLQRQPFLQLFGRCDVCDLSGNWFSGTIIDIIEDTVTETVKVRRKRSQKDTFSATYDSDSDGDAMGRVRSSDSSDEEEETTETRKRRRVHIRVDGFPPKYDEIVDIRLGHRLRPLNTFVPAPRLELVETTLVHRVRRQPEVDMEGGEGVPVAVAEDVPSQSFGTELPFAAAIPADESQAERYIGTPSFIYFSSHLNNSELLNVIREHVKSCAKSPADGSESNPEDLYKVYVTKLNRPVYNNRRQLAKDMCCPGIRNGESIVIEWSSYKFYDKIVDEVQRHTSVDKAEGARYAAKQDADITLDDCLKQFSSPEKLGDGYKCDHCNAENTTSSAYDVWRLPDILVIHVKRFVYTMYVRGKLNNMMKYPVNNLDMSKVLGKAAADFDPNRERYDLYGVVHHYGTMRGGHYVATCKNESPNQDGKWYTFNDSRVIELGENQEVQSSGYLLFYSRKRMSAHNMINLNPPVID
jgi:ubiquitin C-terminal hydrolase